MKHGRAAFGFVFVTVLLDMLALGIIVPVLPKLIIQFEHGNIADAAKATGLFAFVWAAMQFVFSPVVGVLSDHYGRRPVILLSNLGLGLDYILMALAPSLGWLFLGRAISGITASSFPTASAYVADVTPAEERAGKFGMLGAAFGVGFILGPALGGFLGGMDLRYPFWAAASLSLANFVYGFFILPESLPLEKRAPFSFANANPLGSLRLLRSHPQLSGLATAKFLHSNAHEALPVMFVLYTTYRYNWSEQLTGLTLALVGIVSTFVSAVLIRKTIQRFGEVRTLYIGTLFGIVGFVIYAAAPNTLAFLVGCPFVSLWGLSSPCIQSMMSKRVSASEQGQLHGALASLFGIAGMISPLLFTAVFSWAVAPERAVKFPGVAYWMPAMLLVAMLWTVRKANASLAVE